MGPCDPKETYKKIHEMKILEQYQDPNGSNTITWQIVGRELIEENRTPLKNWLTNQEVQPKPQNSSEYMTCFLLTYHKYGKVQVCLEKWTHAN